ncbi:MAG: ABC transporter permease [Dehalococcoidales bacterium]|nr:ABC transporter permease [Dehalococcoidales bacterium]
MIDRPVEISPGIAPKVQSKRRSGFMDFLYRLVKEKPLGTVGAIITLLFILTGIFANFIAPYGMNEVNVVDRLSPPFGNYLLGTDNLGRDLFSRIIYGAQISMYVGMVGSVVCTGLATLIGMVSGYFGGKVDIIIQRFVDAWMAFPDLVLYLSVMALVGPGLTQVMLVLGIHRGIAQSRVIRGAVISVKENVYVEASRAIGTSNFKILLRHILPNILAPVVIIFTISTGYLILGEATLSFLGFGVPPPAPSWGGMLSQAGRKYMYLAPWMAIWPGIAVALVVYGINMFGDAVRDLLDPRLRGGIGRYGGVKKKKLS